MDDCLSGEADLQKTQILQDQLIEILRSANMKLHKWCSNHPELLSKFLLKEKEYTFREDENKSIKALGVIWQPSNDSFKYKVKVQQQDSYTKRDVLSCISRIFDPLGLIGPVVTKAKIFLQKLWLLKLNWDDTLPEDISNKWHQFVSTLPDIEKLSIPRLVCGSASVVLQGYADASSLAYGASIYVQTVLESGEVISRLLCSKSRVAPIKTITIPRLELCACVLLSKLTVKVLAALEIKVERVFLYTDSTIALAWIKKSPHELKTFVANRVATIQNLTDSGQWEHISTQNNPSDIISRGLDTTDIMNCDLWWTGPTNVNNSGLSTRTDDEHLSEKDYLSELKELPNISLTLMISEKLNFLNLLLCISNDYLKLIRIISYVYRFVKQCRAEEKPNLGTLTAEEISAAELKLISLVQAGEYQEEINSLKKSGSVSKYSKLKDLNPFIENGIIRVGGRIDKSNVSYDTKHPIILPSSSKLSKMLMQYYHVKNLHVGPLTMLNLIRQKYWIVNGRSLARKIVKECVTCFKSKPILTEQIMGNLPLERVTPSPPFSVSGIDFCGPFLIKYKGQRKGIYHKVYVAVFVCLSTKCIHLELVTDLSSDGLIAALKRFFARRGKSSCIITDNGGNFIGANQELKRIHKLISHPDNNISNYLACEGIKWKFIPPRAPHFGGIWEAGVKSFKYHLRRTLGNSKVTIEELLTIVTQIEGILNSRPITPLSNNPLDFEALTPGHFLIGQAINNIIEPDTRAKPDNRLSRWQQMTKMVQSIWQRWHIDYLSNLQQRSKWRFAKDNIKKDTMVVLKEDNLPPGKWLIGRIIDTIPGKDHKIRVVIVKTANGIFKRPITKIGILPVEN